MNILEIRKRMGLSQKSLGQLIGYTERQVQRWEAGDTPVPAFVQGLLSNPFIFRKLDLDQETRQKS